MKDYIQDDLNIYDPLLNGFDINCGWGRILEYLSEKKWDL